MTSTRTRPHRPRTGVTVRVAVGTGAGRPRNANGDRVERFRPSVDAAAAVRGPERTKDLPGHPSEAPKSRDRPARGTLFGGVDETPGRRGPPTDPVNRGRRPPTVLPCSGPTHRENSRCPPSIPDRRDGSRPARPDCRSGGVGPAGPGGGGCLRRRGPRGLYPIRPDHGLAAPTWPVPVVHGDHQRRRLSTDRGVDGLSHPDRHTSADGVGPDAPSRRHSRPGGAPRSGTTDGWAAMRRAQRPAPGRPTGSPRTAGFPGTAGEKSSGRSSASVSSVGSPPLRLRGGHRRGGLRHRPPDCAGFCGGDPVRGAVGGVGRGLLATSWVFPATTGTGPGGSEDSAGGKAAGDAVAGSRSGPRWVRRCGISPIGRPDPPRLRFPWGTLAVNVAGSFLLGFLVALPADPATTPWSAPDSAVR